MTYHREQQQRQAMRSAQIAYDNATPPDEGPAFLDTPQGQEWLGESAADLVKGQAVKHVDLAFFKQVLIEDDDFMDCAARYMMHKLSGASGLFLEGREDECRAEALRKATEYLEDVAEDVAAEMRRDER